ncbi:MAG TPA: OsmC family protein [Deferrisomatales bacterium]|nr:OsmC family protein [Deferrisomatales bacterium]
MSMEIHFPGGVAVTAQYKGFTIATDQPEGNGGANSAPSPFDLFLASLGTCAGFFALRFCQQRDIGTAGLRLTLDSERDPETHRVSQVRIEIHLPEEFPEKYRKAIVRATDQCSVKRHILEPPAFAVVAV